MTTGTPAFWRWRLSGSLDFDAKEHLERLKEIREEAYAFLCQEDGDSLPDGKGDYIKFEMVPDCVYWKRWTDRYGFPYEGGWTKQPLFFMQDIEAVRRAEDMRKAEKPSIEQLLTTITTLLKR